MTGTFRVLVTGTRENSPLVEYMVHGWLDKLVAGDYVPQGRRIIVVHGACPTGVDFYADQWATSRQLDVERHPADWRQGKMAGPRRNTRMVETKPNWCLGFPGRGSRGTWDCLQKAVNAGIPTQIYVIQGFEGGTDA